MDINGAPTLIASITAGVKPTMINYLLMDFGTGVFIAPTGTNTSTKFMDQFQQTALSIHNLFQQTIQSKVIASRMTFLFIFLRQRFLPIVGSLNGK
jgi:hypothetical protein